MKTMGKYLRRLRLDAELTQRDVSGYLGHEGPQFVSNWERGLSFPSVHNFKGLASLYEVNVWGILAYYMAAVRRRAVITIKRS